MRYMLNRLFFGRNGIDRLNVALLCAAIICSVLSSVFPIRLIAWAFHWVSLLSLAWGCVRALSRNIAKRQLENQRFLQHFDALHDHGSLGRKLAQHKSYKVFKCPCCGIKLRVPRGKGKIQVSCRQCGARFEKKS